MSGQKESSGLHSSPSPELWWHVAHLAQQCVTSVKLPLHLMLQKLCNNASCAFRTSGLVPVHMNYSAIIQIIPGPKWPSGVSPSSQTSALTLSLSLLVAKLSDWL